MDKKFLDSQRFIGDIEADAIVQSCFSAGRQQELYQALTTGSEDRLHGKGSIYDFLISERPAPSWFIVARINSGQRIFQQYAAEIMTLLGVMALPYCYAGTPGNKALFLAEKMRVAPGKRLHDTASFIVGVATPGSFQNDTAQLHINKTRIIHSIARYFVSRKNWDPSWGVPINQEDMAGTNLAFSAIILFGLQRSGHTLTKSQKEDFIFLWRYIGYQLGIDERLLPSDFKEAVSLVEIIKQRNFKFSVEGQELARELISYYREIIPSNRSSLIEAQIRFYLGKEVSACIGLQGDFIEDTIASIANSFSELKALMLPHSESYQQMLLHLQKNSDRT